MWQNGEQSELCEVTQEYIFINVMKYIVLSFNLGNSVHSVLCMFIYYIHLKSRYWPVNLLMTCIY